MRLIDADALIEDIRKHSESYFADDFAHEWVDKQPTIIPDRKTEQWIPVSERMPVESGEYLVTYDGIATTLDYSDKYGWYYDDGEHFTRFGDDVIAWMPLPEPYEEG